MDEHDGFRPPTGGEDDEVPSPDTDDETTDEDGPDSGGPALSFSESGGTLPHWSEPATGEVPVIGDAPGSPREPSVSTPPREATGGSRLFPQLPDDPQMTERQADTDVFRPVATDEPAAERTALSGSDIEIIPDEEPDEEPAPALFDDADDNLSAWSSLDSPQPRWRDRASDWDDDEPSIVISGATAGEPSAPKADQAWAAATDEESPTSREPDSDRNVPVAIVTGLALAAAFLVLLRAAPGAVMVLVCAVIAMAAAEFFGATRRAGFRPATLLGLAASVALPLAAFWKGPDAIPIVLGLVVVFTMLWYLLGVEVEAPTANISLTIMGIMWIGFLGSFAGLILGLRHGEGILLGAVAGTVAYDLGGYLIGRTTGQSQLAPRVSPNKTWEGLIGGMILAVLVTTLLFGIAPGVTPWDSQTSDALWLALVVAIAAPIGDLAQSLIKRDLGIKDMGTVLPGHGGVLDRFDALLFVLPATYYVVRVLELQLIP